MIEPEVFQSAPMHTPLNGEVVAPHLQAASFPAQEHAPPVRKKTSTGSDFEGLVRRSARGIKNPDLDLRQTSPRVAGKYGANGRVTGRVQGVGQLDFVGFWQGRYLSFDCKSTKVRSRFDLRLIHEHQAKALAKAHNAKGIAFLLVEFSQGTGEGTEPEVYALGWDILMPWWNGYMRSFHENGHPASIPADTLRLFCPRVERVGKLLDILAAVKAMAPK